MAADPQKTMANRTDRAENEMLLRRILLKYGYDQLPDNAVSQFLMRLGPAGDIASMAGLDFISRALTPRGSNIPPAGMAPDGTPWVEYFDTAMRNSKNQSARGMAGEAVAMIGASSAGLAMTGPVGWLVMGVGQLLGRSNVLEKIPVVKDVFSALKSAFTPRGTNLQPMNVIELSREMVTFTRNKFLGHKGLVLSGSDIEKIADQPTENPNELTVKFDRIWRLEKKLPDPSVGPLHQLVKELADYTDKKATPMDALTLESFDKDPNHPFYIEKNLPDTNSDQPQRQESRQHAWEIATDSILSLCGIPDLKAANTGYVMTMHKAAMTGVGSAELHRAEQAADAQPPEKFNGKDWAKVPDNHFITLATRYNKEGIKTDTFLCLQTEEGPVYLGSDGKSAYGRSYTADEFKHLVESRENYTSNIEVSASRLPREWMDEELKSAKPLHEGQDFSLVGKSVKFMEGSERPDQSLQGRAVVAEVRQPTVAPDVAAAPVHKQQPVFTIS